MSIQNIVRNVIGERLDVKKSSVNCFGCGHKVGTVCDYYHARLQSNPHRPTDCKNWIPKQEGGCL